MSLMEIKELLSENTGTLLAIVAITMTLVEITPIKMVYIWALDWTYFQW